MANIDRMGFIPVGMLDGSRVPVYRFPVDNGDSTYNLFVGDVVKAYGTGTPATGVRRSAANDESIVVGVVVGLFDSDENPVGSPNGSVSTKYLPLSTAGYADVALFLPGSKFRAQAATALAATDIMGSIDHVAGTGSTVKATSAHELNGAAINTEAQFTILGLVNDPLNSWGADQELIVTPRQSFWGIVDNSTGV